MEVTITYLHHSCLSLSTEDKIFLFDYPGRQVRKKAEEEFIDQIEGKDLYLLISHGHGDHFSPDVTKFSEYAERTVLIASSDVNISRMDLDKIDAVIEAEPDSSYDHKDLKINTYKSNDEGVAFLITLKEKILVYFGGDLAKWDWPEWSVKKRREHVKVFDEVVESLKKKDLDIAFSNMDPRLSSWAGPIEFIEGVKPKYFVPIHTFGSEESIDEMIEKGWSAETEIFHYTSPGDKITWIL